MALVLHLLPRLAGPQLPEQQAGRHGASASRPPRAGGSLPQAQRAAAPGPQAGRRGAGLVARAAGGQDIPAPHGFDLARYRLAEIASVRQEPSVAFGPPNWVILLKIPDINRAMAVYVGDFEGVSLNRDMPANGHHHPAARPMTHDLMKNSLTALGARVAKVCITALVDNTYHARVHYLVDGSAQEVVVDARPSDALNLAHRFSAPIYVNRAVADTMAHPLAAFERGGAAAPPGDAAGEVPAEVARSCREALKRYHDPTVVHKVNMQVAIAENRFEDAAQIRNEIERLLSRDRTLSLAVAMESALEDKRWEEAALLRNELTRLTDAVPEGRLQDA